ncbi:MAG: hypothetical protein JOZ08_18905 [Verrucomicrobia bacterium]|nr:hypothetical protein [Verrucomicrobiota bacterium]
MYLVLGGTNTPLLERIQIVCNEQSESIVSLVHLDSKIVFAWSFDSKDSNSVVEAAMGVRLGEQEITGVLVQKPPRLDPAADFGEQAEHSQMERNAVIFAWFWSLPCPVINRCSPVFWFAPRAPLSFWKPLVVKCGLRTVDSVFSNVESELRAFASDHNGNVSYSPLCDCEIYRIASENDWDGLNKMAAICPVNLVSIPAPLYSACVVGGEVFWNTTVIPPYFDTEDRLRKLAVLAGLDFLEVRLAIGKDFLRVVAVEAFPDLGGFNEESIRKIAETLIKLLQSSGTLVPSGPVRRRI